MAVNKHKKGSTAARRTKPATKHQPDVLKFREQQPNNNGKTAPATHKTNKKKEKTMCCNHR